MFKTRLKVFSTVASIMVGIFLMGVFEARGQSNLCTQPFATGWLQVIVNEALLPDNDVDFNDAILGTFDQLAPVGEIVGDADWFYNDEAFSTADDLGMLVFPTAGANTTIVGTQAVGWWSLVAERSTVVQITNMAQKDTCPVECDADLSNCPRDTADPDTADNCFNSQQVLLTGFNDFTAGAARLSLHVQFFGSNCNEILDFCDTMSAFDTHVYDLAPGALVTNDGVAINTDALVGDEGFITVTPVVNCPNNNTAIAWDYLHGSVEISDFANQFPVEYGFNTFMRDTVLCDGCTTLGNEDFTACILEGQGGVCRFREMNPPNFITQNFNTIGLTSRSDVVFINFGDAYDLASFGYTPVAAFVDLSPGQRDEDENFVSCGSRQVCFARFGLDPVVPGSDEPIPPIVTPTPTPSPTPTPPPGCTSDADCTFPDVCDLTTGECVPVPCTEDTDCVAGAICGDADVCVPGCTEDHACPAGQDCANIDPDTGIGECVVPTPTPTPGGNFGSSGSCTTIAGAAPVQLGTAMANILIPLVPALAIGFRMIRRKKKGQK